MNIVVNRLFDFNDVPPMDGLKAAWNLSNVNDSAGVNHLTNNNAATFVAGKIGNAVNLDGVNQYLSIASNANLVQPKTFCGWFKLDTMPVGVGAIIAKWAAAGNREYQVVVLGSGINNSLGLFVSDDGTATTSVGTAANVIFANVWYFFCFWADDMNISLELNNNGAISAVPYTGIFSGTSELRIGSQEESGASFIDGLVDAVRIYNRVLTAAERAVLYNAGVGREYVASSVVSSDEVNKELNQLINIFNGITRDVTPTIVASDTVDPILTINQNGAGPIAQFYSGVTLKAEITNDGQFKSYVPVGTAPFLLANLPTQLLVDGLNVDLLSGLNAVDFLQNTSYLSDGVSTIFVGTPIVGDRQFIPAMEAPAILTVICVQQRATASANATTGISIKKDNASEDAVASITLNGNTQLVVPFNIVDVVMDTARLILEIDFIGGTTPHADITVSFIYKYTPF